MKKRVLSSFAAMIAVCVLILTSVLPVNAAAASSTAKIRISPENKVIVIRVATASGKFNESWGGVMGAVPVKATDVYSLYDVIMWPDRMSLYRFPDDVDVLSAEATEKYEKKHPDGERDEEEYEKIWRKVREEYCLGTFKFKNENVDMDKASPKRLKAFKSFFKTIEKREQPNHVVIKFSGHGGYSDRSNFCFALNSSDTKKLLKYSVGLFGQKFSIIDYGTNCQSGYTAMISGYADYADYMIVSQLDFGGWSMDKWDYEIYKKVDTDMVYHKMFVDGETIKQAAVRMGKQHTKPWPYARKNLKKGKFAQSVTVINMAEYKKLKKSTQSALKKYISQYSPKDLKTVIKKTNKKKYLTAYNKTVIYYANDKKQLGKWKASYGYGLWFNGF